MEVTQVSSQDPAATASTVATAARRAGTRVVPAMAVTHPRRAPTTAGAVTAAEPVGMVPAARAGMAHRAAEAARAGPEDCSRVAAVPAETAAQRSRGARTEAAAALAVPPEHPLGPDRAAPAERVARAALAPPPHRAAQAAAVVWEEPVEASRATVVPAAQAVPAEQGARDRPGRLAREPTARSAPPVARAARAVAADSRVLPLVKAAPGAPVARVVPVERAALEASARRAAMEALAVRVPMAATVAKAVGADPRSQPARPASAATAVTAVSQGRQVMVAPAAPVL